MSARSALMWLKACARCSTTTLGSPKSISPAPGMFGGERRSCLLQTKLRRPAIYLYMDTTPYWIDSAPIRSFPSLGADLKVDVLVVGAGITGITAAYLLKQAGVGVALIERERVASIDTGHTTAHLTYVTDLSLSDLAKHVGRDHAQAAWDAGACAVDQIERIVREENIDCDFTRVPGFMHASIFGEGSENDRETLKREAELATDLGFDAAFMD